MNQNSLSSARVVGCPDIKSGHGVWRHGVFLHCIAHHVVVFFFVGRLHAVTGGSRCVIDLFHPSVGLVAVLDVLDGAEALGDESENCKAV